MFYHVNQCTIKEYRSNYCYILWADIENLQTKKCLLSMWTVKSPAGILKETKTQREFLLFLTW